MSAELPAKKTAWQTSLVSPTLRVSSDAFRSLVPPTHRGSTVVFDRLADARDDWRGEEYTYGLYGTPTTRELAARIAEIERAKSSFIVPGGQSAILLIYMAFCRSGGHALVPETAYGPNLELAQNLLSGLGIEVEAYDPLIGGAISALFRPNTQLVWCESPGSITMEIQDVPAIAYAAHHAGVPVAVDNTYAAGVFFDAFSHGVDISMQAVTKYIGGHSDILLGSVSVSNQTAEERIGATHRLLGLAVSPDDCSLALRGMETLAVRLDRLQSTAFEVAQWCQRRKEITTVLHPALASCPGHTIWERDFTGSSSVFSIVLHPDWNWERIRAFVESLQIFKIGFSWGGTTSLVMAYESLPRKFSDYGNRVVRLNVGLELADDLIADLQQAFESVAT